jgi:predicted TPR repeat methyltransferase
MSEQASTLARLTEQAGAFARLGRFAAARALLAAIRRRNGEGAAVEEVDARVCLGEGRVGEARAALDRAIAAAPGTAGLHLLRADLRARMDDLRGAALDASEAVVLRPADPGAKAMLGLVMLELGEIDDALACLREAVRDAPEVAAHWQGVAEALRRAGDAAAAAEAFDAGIAAVPGHAGLRAAAMTLALHGRDFARTEALGRAAMEEGAADACVLGLLGHALSHLGRHAEAGEAYREALKLAPEDEYVRHMVRASGLLPDSPRAPDDYLEAVFDGYAAGFEKHLLGLGYRLPGLLRLRFAAAPALERVLDLGCGTGLVGMMLADFAVAEMVGVDISGRMLAEAERKGVYARLERREVGAFLEGDPGGWDTIVAADVFCYFGALEAIMRLVRARLAPGGRFAFSVEEMPEGGEAPWRLASQGRFQHRDGYVAACIDGAGFVVEHLARETLRLEAGAPVPGLFAVLRRPVADA